METQWLKTTELDSAAYDSAIDRAAALLRAGELVAFPTETVYGLGGNALDDTAAHRIYAAKGRPSDNPLIVHISHIDMAEELVTDMIPLFRRLAFEFWPGPLTMILPKTAKIPDSTTGGLPTVALRMPAHRVALDLIDRAGLPLAAPSANLSGKPSTTRGAHVFHDLAGKIPLILDGGDAVVGLESTIVDLTGERPAILRPGKITYEDLKPFAPTLLGSVTVPESERPRAPGMKYRHYAPAATVLRVPSPAALRAAFAAAKAEGRRVALVVSEELWSAVQAEVAPDLLLLLGTDADSAAHRLFDHFRRCDAAGMDVVLVEEFAEQGVGIALMNRIAKASLAPPEQG